MKANRYLVLIKFAAALTRPNLAAIAPLVNSAVRQTLSDCEAILCTETAVSYVGLATCDASELFPAISQSLRPGDDLHVLSLGNSSATAHPGLHTWLLRTAATSPR